MSNDALKQQAVSLQGLAEVAYVQADEQLGPRNWSRLVFDYRFSSEGAQAMWQFRAMTSTGTKHLSSRHLSDARYALHCLRSELPGAPWFGLCLILLSDGKTHVTYDYNPYCLDGILEDTRFYEDLL